MKFTYAPCSNVIIMTTRRDTRKFRNLLANPRAAVLLHDYPEPVFTTGDVEADTDALISQSVGHVSALTLYGKARLPRTKEADEYYRKIHMNNPHCKGYFQFILPREEFAVVLLDVHFSKMCDINDKVVNFQYEDADADGGASRQRPGDAHNAWSGMCSWQSAGTVS